MRKHSSTIPQHASLKINLYISSFLLSEVVDIHVEVCIFCCFTAFHTYVEFSNGLKMIFHHDSSSYDMRNKTEKQNNPPFSAIYLHS